MTRTTPSHRFLVAGIAAVAFLSGLSGCGSAGSSGPAAESVPATPSAGTTVDPSPGAPRSSGTAVPAAFDFTGITVDGARFHGRTLAGKPTVLWFWAPWCPVCRSQQPAVESLVATYGDRVNVVGIGSLDSGSAIDDFAADVTGPIQLRDPEGELWKRFRISEQSSFIVLDGAGREVLRTGYADDDAVAGTVKKLAG